MWDKHLAIAMILWLSADAWQFGLMAYRHFSGPRSLLREYLPYLFIFAFVWERAQRIAAYCVAVLLVKSSVTEGEKAVFAGTVFLLDFVDIWFEVSLIRKQFRSRSVIERTEQAANYELDGDIVDLV